MALHSGVLAALALGLWSSAAAQTPSPTPSPFVCPTLQPPRSPALTPATAPREASDRLVTVARKLQGNPSRATILAAIDTLRQATALDPSNAMAFARLSAAYQSSSRYADVPPALARERSLAALSTAASLDPDSPYVLERLGDAAVYQMRDMSCARRMLEQAVRLAPTNASAQFAYAHLLGSAGDFKAAFAHMETGLANADTDARVALLLNSGRIHYMAREPEWVVRHYTDFIATYPDRASLAHFYRGLAYAELGRFDLSLSEQQLATPSTSGDAGGVANLARAYVLAGDTVTGRATLQVLLDRAARGEHVVHYQIATVYEALGEPDAVFRYLNIAFDREDGSAGWLLWLKLDPRWDRLRHDTRFAAITAKAGLASQ